MAGIATAQTGFTQDAFESFLAGRREPAWCIALRRQAWAAFEALPLPERTLEEWMRTDIRGFHFEQFGLPPSNLPSPFGRGVGGEGRTEGDGQCEPLPALTLTLSQRERGQLCEGVDLSGSVSALDSRPYDCRIDSVLTQRGVLFGSLDELVAWLKRRRNRDRDKKHNE